MPETGLSHCIIIVCVNIKPFFCFCLFSSKKQTNEFNSTTMIPRLVFVGFLEEMEDTKNILKLNDLYATTFNSWPGLPIKRMIRRPLLPTIVRGRSDNFGVALMP